jgi:hypothetical protein
VAVRLEPLPALGVAGDEPPSLRERLLLETGDLRFAPKGGTGIAGMAAAWRKFLSTWEEGYRTEVDEYRELDGERVFVTNYYIDRGKTSGLEVGQICAKGANIFHLREGRVTRFVMYWDDKRAFVDLDLTPDSCT